MKTLLQKPLFWFVLAMLVRLAYLQEQSGHFTFYQQMLDEREVAETARNGFPTGEPFFKAPLYVYFIRMVMAISGDAWVWLARLIQHFCGGLLVVLGFDAARRMTRSSVAAAIVAGMLCFYGPLIRLENRLILDFFTVFLQSAMLWAMLRIPDDPKKMKWAIIASAFAGLSWLNRPTIMPVLPFLALWLFMHQRPWKPNLKLAGVYLVFPLIALGGFTLRNQLASGQALTTPWQGGYNFYQANKPEANGRYLVQEHMAAAHSGNPTKELMRVQFQVALPDGTSRYPDLPYGLLNEHWFDQGFDAIKENVPAWLSLMLRKGFYLVTAREIYNFEDYQIMRELSSVLKLTGFNFGWLWPLAFASLAFCRKWRSEHLLAAVYLLLLGGAIALFFTSGRLRMPLVFPVVLLAATTIAHLLKNPKHLLTWALIALGMALSWVDWWGVRSEDLRDIEYARLSNAAWRAGENETALSYADQSVELQTQNPQIQQLRGQALHGLNRFDEAIAAYKQSTLSLPQDPNAFYNLGLIYYRNLEIIEAGYHAFEAAGSRGMADGYLMTARLINQHKHPQSLGGDPSTVEEQIKQAFEAGQPSPKILSITTICIAAKKGDHAAVKHMSRELEANFGQPAMDELAWELGKLGYRP
ncbi:MAG: 4-amino-4-deoxy-L-arabinose transferase-like glycosyltransferase [Kiritimatiellia bacterium]|jgi:4-amino-4-deoxy-L-arabinose transferase-like glycosyltransferase